MERIVITEKKTKNYEKMYNTSPRVLYGEFTHYLYLVVDFKLPQIFGSFNFFPSNCQSKLLPNTTSLTFTFFFFYNTHQIFFLRFFFSAFMKYCTTSLILFPFYPRFKVLLSFYCTTTIWMNLICVAPWITANW